MKVKETTRARMQKIISAFTGGADHADAERTYPRTYPPTWPDEATPRADAVDKDTQRFREYVDQQLNNHVPADVARQRMMQRQHQRPANGQTYLDKIAAARWSNTSNPCGRTLTPADMREIKDGGDA